MVVTQKICALLLHTAPLCHKILHPLYHHFPHHCLFVSQAGNFHGRSLYICWNNCLLLSNLIVSVWLHIVPGQWSMVIVSLFLLWYYSLLDGSSQNMYV